MNKQPLLFAGSSHKELAKETCEELGVSLGSLSLKCFPDGEISVEILEDVQGKDVFILQSLAIDPNYYLMELLITIDALKRSLAKSITAIVPYLGYARQDKRNKPGMPITAKLVANLLSSAGIDHLVTFDLHADQIEGFFEIPITHLHSQLLLSEHIRPFCCDNLIVVAPDVGSIKIAESMAKQLSAGLAIIKKDRHTSYDVEMTLIGDVKGKNVLISDDLCSTAGTLVAAAKLCHENGALTVMASITHGLFVEDAMQKIEASPLTFLVTTNTIPLALSSKKIVEVSVAKLIAETLKKLSQEVSFAW